MSPIKSHHTDLSIAVLLACTSWYVAIYTLDVGSLTSDASVIGQLSRILSQPEKTTDFPVAISSDSHASSRTILEPSSVSPTQIQITESINPSKAISIASPAISSENQSATAQSKGDGTLNTTENVRSNQNSAGNSASKRQSGDLLKLLALYYMLHR
jgi:hypothetical protein